MDPADLYNEKVKAENNKKVAIVTGAARGIGKGVALQLASDGFNVCVNDIQSMKGELEATSKEIREMFKVKSIPVLADVSDPAQNARMIKETVEGLGRLDVAVANAGIAISKTIMETTPEDWDRLFSINARGVFLTFKNAAEVMISQGQGGRLIGACSVGGYKANSILTAYCATKFAVRGLTQGFAQEMAQYNITVNSYCPGVVATDMWQVMDKYLSEKDLCKPGEAMQNASQRAAIKRPEVPSDLGRFVSYLASEGSAFMTGQSVIIDGGYHFG